jgi:hypothetical protein
MIEIAIWTATFAIGLSLLAVAAGAKAYVLHLAVAAMVSLAIAGLMLRENVAAVSSQRELLALSSRNARYMAAIWTFGASAMLLQYTAILAWEEWWHFVIGFIVAALGCLLFSHFFKSSVGDPERAQRYLTIAWWLAVLQLLAMSVTVVGLLVDGKMDFGYVDWAGNNVFFCGAIALAVMSAVSLWTYHRAQGAGVVSA